MLASLAGVLVCHCTFDHRGLAPADGGKVNDDRFVPRRHDKSVKRDRPRPDQRVPDLAITRLPDAKADTVRPDAPKACTQGAFRCGGPKNEESLICTKNGGYVEYAKCIMGCDSKTGRCRNFDISNGAGAVQGNANGNWRITGTVTYNTSNNTFNPPQSSSAVVPYCLAKWCLLSVNRLLIESAGVLQVVGRRPLIIMVDGNANVDGTITVSASGTRPGAGGHNGGSGGGKGSGCGGGAAGNTWGIFDPLGGGAGGSFGGAGGDGSHKGAPICAPTCLVPLVGGSGGGDGQSREGEGGGGGGSLQITALVSIDVKGKVLASGGGGRGGREDFGAGSGGGGGGSGGGILLEAPYLFVSGLLAANGGGGGGGASATKSGKAGLDGQPSAVPAAGGKGGSGWLSAGSGGLGAAGMALSGGGGSRQNWAAGGGGGGAGRICLRSKTGKATLNKPTISPATGPAFHQDALKVVAP